jgi:hypothetical protein
VCPYEENAKIKAKSGCATREKCGSARPRMSQSFMAIFQFAQQNNFLYSLAGIDLAGKEIHIT